MAVACSLLNIKIDGPEPEVDLAAEIGVRHVEAARVPENVMQIAPPDPASTRLEGKRNQDLTAERRLPGGPALQQANVGVVESELPDAIEVQPITADELRSRVLRPRSEEILLCHDFLKRMPREGSPPLWSPSAADWFP